MTLANKHAFERRPQNISVRDCNVICHSFLRSCPCAAVIGKAANLRAAYEAVAYPEPDSASLALRGGFVREALLGVPACFFPCSQIMIRG